jgi:hypothetical protein
MQFERHRRVPQVFDWLLLTACLQLVGAGTGCVSWRKDGNRTSIEIASLWDIKYDVLRLGSGMIIGCWIVHVIELKGV